MKIRYKILRSVLLALFLLGLGMGIGLRVATYPAYPEAVAVAEAARTPQGWYVFAPESEAHVGLIFYPGGLVEPEAYAPLLQHLSTEGVLTVLVPMPLNLAVLGIDRAAAVQAAFPQIERWIIAGHSLGGAMAAEYVKRHPQAVQGLVLLASYPAEQTDLSTLPLKAISIVGTEDGVDESVFAASLARLPANTPLIIIEGGNHAQFGFYGPQKGDGTPTISRAAQQEQTVGALKTLLESLATAKPAP